jgi:hypothetical protein
MLDASGAEEEKLLAAYAARLARDPTWTPKAEDAALIDRLAAKHGALARREAEALLEQAAAKYKDAAGFFMAHTAKRLWDESPGSAEAVFADVLALTGDIGARDGDTLLRPRGHSYGVRELTGQVGASQ